MLDFGDRHEFDAHVVANAAAFCATAFRGRAHYEKTISPTLDGARAAASQLYEDRPVAIYALLGDRQVHVENWAPYPLNYSSRDR